MRGVGAGEDQETGKTPKKNGCRVQLEKRLSNTDGEVHIRRGSKKEQECELNAKPTKMFQNLRPAGFAPAVSSLGGKQLNY